MWLRSKFLVILLLQVHLAGATHIIGGEMYYDHLGGDQYQITMELYRDCGPDNTLGTGFDFNVSIAVFDNNGNFLFTFTMTDPGETNVPVVINDPCLGAPPNVCIATTIYTDVVSLPPIPGGYHLAYQRCCRTPAIVNLMIPNEQGVTCTVKVPGPPDANNSSPRFTQYPTIALCIGVDMVIDHSATDPDGDELVYELCSPFQGASNADPAPAIPTPPPYTPVVWGMGYSELAPLDSDPPIAIDATTGILTVSPTVMGSFVVGVRVRELRNGVQLSEVIRDFKFTVVSCELDVVAEIVAVSADELFDCNSATFTNGSMNATSYFWDFGDPNTLADTSVLADPQWTYAQGGTYTVTLIANPGSACSDTTQVEVTSPSPFGAVFEPQEGLCVGLEYEFPALGDLPPGVSFEWIIPEAATSSTLDEPVLSVSFSTPGVHVMTLTIASTDCSESYTDSVIVFSRPVADFTSDSLICKGETITFEDLSSAMTPLTYLWDLGDGSTSTDQFLIHLYEEPGTYTVGLTVATSDGCVMEDTHVSVGQVTVHPLPVAGFRVTPNVVSMINAEVEVLDHAEGAVDWIYQIEGQLVHEPEFTHWFDDAGYITVWQTVISEHGCRDSVPFDVFITDHLFYAPNTFTPNGDGLNDTFAPVVKGARTYEITIYDRYGRELFRSTDPKAEWNGDQYPQGLYNYKVHIAEYGTHRQEYQGHITLLR